MKKFETIEGWLLCALLAGALGGCGVETGGSREATQELNAAQLQQECEQACASSQQLSCGETLDECVDECTFVAPLEPGCRNIYADLIECASDLPPSGFTCMGDAAYINGCTEHILALNACELSEVGEACSINRQCTSGFCDEGTCGPVKPNGVTGLCEAQCAQLQKLACGESTDSCYQRCAGFVDSFPECAAEYQNLTQCTHASAPDDFVCFGPSAFLDPAKAICQAEQFELIRCAFF